MARDQGSDHSPALGTAEAYQILGSCITCMCCMGAQQGASRKKRLSRKDKAPFKHTTASPKPQDEFCPQNSLQDEITQCLALVDPAAFPLGVAAAEPPQCTPTHRDQTSFTTPVVRGVFAHFYHIMHVYPIHFTKMGEHSAEAKVLKKDQRSII